MSCDNCGNPIQDKDEILCRTCKPSLKEKADREEEIRKLWNRMDSAYWRFTRCANALPPSLADPEAHFRLIELGRPYS